VPSDGTGSPDEVGGTILGANWPVVGRLGVVERGLFAPRRGDRDRGTPRERPGVMVRVGRPRVKSTDTSRGAGEHLGGGTMAIRVASMTSTAIRSLGPSLE
jgi:hypothetical protein